MAPASDDVSRVGLRHPLAQALLALTATTGLVDAATYLGLGRVFAANMTGNVLLLGFGLAGGTDLPVAAPLLSLGAFLLGAFVGGRIETRVAGRRPAHLVVALSVETVLGGGALAVALVTDPRAGATSGDVLIALLAVSMGIRTAAVRSLAVPDLTTTVLTSTLTGLAAEIGEDGFRRSATRRGAAVAAMLVGAAVGALLIRVGLWLPLAVGPVVLVATGAGYTRATRSARR